MSKLHFPLLRYVLIAQLSHLFSKYTLLSLENENELHFNSFLSLLLLAPCIGLVDSTTEASLMQ